MANFVGSSGTLVSAALETMGLCYQSLLLDALTAPLRGPIGALLYVVAVMTAITTIIVTGKFKMARWLMMGPILFLTIINQRTEATGSQWLFGLQPRDQSAVDLRVQEMKERSPAALELNGSPIKVSSIFAAYDNMVSKSVQEAVRVIHGARSDIDARFINRANLYAAAVSQTSPDANFRSLIHEGLEDGCNDLLNLHQKWDEQVEKADQNNRSFPLPGDTSTINQFNTTATEADKKLYQDFIAQREKDFQHVVNLQNTDGWRYIKGLRLLFPTVINEQSIGPTNNGLFWQNIRNGNADQFDQLMLAAKQKAENPSSIPESEWRQADEWLLQHTSGNFTCQQIWNIVSFGLFLEAGRIVHEAENKGAAAGIPKVELDTTLFYSMFAPDKQTELTLKNNPGLLVSRMDSVYRKIAAYILRNEMAQGSNAAFVNKYKRRGHAIRVVELINEDVDDLDYLERSRLTNQEWEQKSRTMTAGTTIPYYQGLALMILSILFPLFSVLLLVPGKHEGFVMWFLLWLWVKSWDIGFAIVMLLDDILFSMFSLHDKKGMINPAMMQDTSLETILMSYSKLDPTFQMGMYQTIIGAALTSIPVVTSYLVLGALKGGRGLIAHGMQDFANPPASGARMASAQEMNDFLRTKAQDQKAEIFNQYLDNMAKGQPMRIGTPSPQPQEKDIKRHEQSGQNTRPNAAAVSPVKDSAAGAPPVPGANTGKMERDAVAKKTASAYAASVARPWLNTFNARPVGGATGTVAVAEAASAAAYPLLEHWAHIDEQTRKTMLDQAEAWASRDALDSDYSQELARMAVFYKQITIPWVEGGGYEEDFNAQLKQLELRLQWLDKGAKSVETLLTRALNANKSITVHMFVDPEKALKGMGEAAMLQVGVDAFTKELTEAYKHYNLTMKYDPVTGKMVPMTPEEQQRAKDVYEKATGRTVDGKKSTRFKARDHRGNIINHTFDRDPP